MATYIYICVCVSLWLKMLYSSSPISQHFHIQLKRIHGPLGPGLGRRMGLGVHAHVLRRFVDAQTPPPLQPGKGQAADEARPEDDLGFASVRSIWNCVWLAEALKSRLPRCVPSCLVAVLVAIQLGWCVGRVSWFTETKNARIQRDFMEFDQDFIGSSWDLVRIS